MTFKNWMCHPSWPLKSWRGLTMMRLKPKGKSVRVPVHSPVKVTGSYRRARWWGSCSLLNACYNFNVQKAFWNSVSASVALALTIFWSSTHVTTVPPSTEQHRTLTVASGHPSTCRGLEECRQAAVHLWWAFGPNAARNDNIYKPRSAIDSKLILYTHGLDQDNKVEQMHLSKTERANNENCCVTWYERVRGLFLTLQHQTDDDMTHFKDQKVKAISQVRLTLLLKASSAGTTTVAMGLLYPSLHFEN